MVSTCSRYVLLKIEEREGRRPRCNAISLNPKRKTSIEASRAGEAVAEMDEGTDETSPSQLLSYRHHTQVGPKDWYCNYVSFFWTPTDETPDVYVQPTTALVTQPSALTQDLASGTRSATSFPVIPLSITLVSHLSPFA